MSFSKRDFAMFDSARRAAENSTFEGFHLGCVMAYKGRIISSGWNSKKTHPVQKKYNRKYRKFNKSQKPIVDSLHPRDLPRIPDILLTKRLIILK